MLKLHQIPQEEHRGVVADDVEVALRGVEPQRETARVTPGVWAAPLTGHRRKPDQGFSLHPGLEHRSAGEPADIGGHLEVAKGTRSLGVGLTLGDTLPCYLSPGLRATKAAPAAMPPMSWAST